MGEQRLHGAEAEHGRKAEGHVRAVDHLHHSQSQRLRAGLAAMGFGKGEPHPAGLAESLVGLGKTGGGFHAIVCQLRAGLVARGVERGEHLTGELAGLLKDRQDKIGIHIAELAGRQQRVQACNLAQQEGHLLDGGGIGHVISLL